MSKGNVEEIKTLTAYSQLADQNHSMVSDLLSDNKGEAVSDDWLIGVVESFERADFCLVLREENLMAVNDGQGMRRQSDFTACHG